MTLDNEWLRVPAARPDDDARLAAQVRQTTLTKPPRALGSLETLAIKLAALQRTPTPQIERIHITIFAADHGVAAEGVSAFPQAVTREMVRNFYRGGAAINVLARSLGATLDVIDLGTVAEPDIDATARTRLGPGTANFVHEPAMSTTQLSRALVYGRDAVRRASTSETDLFIGGEMGIGNTTAATALACALLCLPPEKMTGPGTGLDTTGVQRKASVIRRALARHVTHFSDPLEILRRLGGFEIAALTGSYIACAQIGIPVLVDGFIATSAALAATRLNPSIDHWLLFAHTSSEPGHRYMLEVLAAEPLLDLQMRLGEGTGAAMAVPLLRLACALHNEMATFAQAGVSTQTE